MLGTMDNWLKMRTMKLSSEIENEGNYREEIRNEGKSGNENTGAWLTEIQVLC